MGLPIGSPSGVPERADLQLRDAAEMRESLNAIATETTTRFDEIAAGMGERLDAVAMELARQHDALVRRTASREQVQQEQSAARFRATAG